MDQTDDSRAPCCFGWWIEPLLFFCKRISQGIFSVLSATSWQSTTIEKPACMKTRLLKNAAILGITQVANYIAPFIILAHLTKTLGLDLYGVLAFAQGIVALCFVLTDFGYSLSATNKISKNRNNKKYVARVISGVFGVKIFLYLVCCLALVLFALLTERYSQYKPIFWLSLIPIAMQAFIPGWFFHGIEKMRLIAVITIGEKMLFALTAVYFVSSPSDYFYVPLLSGFSQFITLALSLYLIRKLGYMLEWPGIANMLYCFKFTRHFFASRVAVASYMGSAIIVLGLIAQPVVVAAYSMAEQLYKVMQSALGPAAAAAYPYMAKEKDPILMIKLICGVIGLAFLGACVGYYSAPFLVVFVFDESWLNSIPILNVFFIAVVIHAAAIMTGYPLAALVNRLDVANSSVITGAIVYFTLLATLFILDLLTPVALAVIMLISEFCVCVHRSVVLLPIAIGIHQAVNSKES